MQKDLKRAVENQQQAVEKKEKEKTSRETLGKYFFDLSKLVFGTMVIGIVLPWVTEFDNPNYWTIFGIGIFNTIMLANIGNRILKKNIMEGYIIIMGGVGVLALGINLWLNTKWGKKWLANL